MQKTYTEGEFAGLTVLKYDRKVFYKNLWHVDERLLECRGTVVDKDWNIVVWPFRKTFNYGENNTFVDNDRMVVVPTKVNGFLGCVTNYKGKLLFSTTGSLDSDYVQYIKDKVAMDIDLYCEGYTYMYEICHEDDPHIVHEETGAYLIGIRNLTTGEFLTEGALDECAKGCDLEMRPSHQVIYFEEALTWCKEADHEGGMVRDANTGEFLCKVKSNHYLSKKALMRVGKAKVDGLYDDPEGFKERIDEEFYSFVDYLVKNLDCEVWRKYNDQQRREVIETFYANNQAF